MNITFAITTDYADDGRLDKIVESIRNLHIPYYEILIIGPGRNGRNGDVRCISFDESLKPGWITRKKNILCQQAIYDTIVLMHDYYVFDNEWYNEFLLFGSDWDICSNQQLLITGARHFTDWVVWDHPTIPRYTPIDYAEWSLTKYMYISGGYYLLKKNIALTYPLNESMLWGSAEDIEWSLRVRNKCKIVCNGHAIVRHNKVHRDAAKTAHF